MRVSNPVLGLRQNFEALYRFITFRYLCYNGNLYVKVVALVLPGALLDFW